MGEFEGVQGLLSNATVRVVSSDAPVCSQEENGGLLWSLTSTGVTQEVSCPGNLIGSVSRRCVSDDSGSAMWLDPSLTKCISHHVHAVTDKVRATLYMSCFPLGKASLKHSIFALQLIGFSRHAYT